MNSYKCDIHITETCICSAYNISLMMRHDRMLQFIKEIAADDDEEHSANHIWSCANDLLEEFGELPEKKDSE